MDCPECGYVMDPFDEDCRRCGWKPQPEAEQRDDPKTDYEAPTSSEFIIDLDDLRPAEELLWSYMGEKMTHPQRLRLLKDEGIDIRDHPAYEQIIQCPNRNLHIECTHSSHNTDEKWQKCIERQAEKMAVKTIVHALGWLERLELWSQPNSMMKYAMWSCIERKSSRACSRCRSREGVIIPVDGVRKVTVFHPGCNCTLIQLLPGYQGAQAVIKTANKLAQRNPGRARTMLENAQRTGPMFKDTPASAAQGVGCAIIPAGIMLAFIGTLWIVSSFPR